MSSSSTNLSVTQLLAFVTDAASAEAIKSVMALRHVSEYRIEAGDVSTATEFLKINASPHTLLVEVPSAEAAPALLDALADVVNPHTRVVITGRVDTLRFYQWLVEIGIHEYLLQPIQETQLISALDKGKAGEKKEEVSNAVKKIIAVIGARGGVGTTTIATHLAAIFANELALPTVLLDLDPYFGSTALGLDLEPIRGMTDALEKPERVDGLFLDRVMIKPSANFSILCAEEPLHQVIMPHANAAPVLFSELQLKSDMIVVDLPRQMNPLTRHVMATADHIIVVTEPELIDLRDALRFQDYVVGQLKRTQPMLVINRGGRDSSKHSVPLSELTKHYGSAPAAEIGLIPEAMDATAQGELLLGNKKVKSSIAPLRALAAQLAGVTVEKETGAKKSGGLFSKRNKKAPS